MLRIRHRFPRGGPLIVVLAVMGLLGGAQARAAELQVFAAASLADVMKKMAVLYEKDAPDDLQWNFAGSNVLARQIQEGAPADVFISADEAKMNMLQQAGLLVDSTRQNLLGNTLVVVVSADSSLVIDSAKSLNQSAIKRIALADPRAVPAGMYAKNYLEKVGVWESVKDRVVPTENVRAALAVVESGDAEVGLVYQTDAATAPTVKIAMEISGKEAPEILYPMAVIKNSKNPDAARTFLQFLQSEPARDLFKQAGFLIRK